MAMIKASEKKINFFRDITDVSPKCRNVLESTNTELYNVGAASNYEKLNSVINPVILGNAEFAKAIAAIQETILSQATICAKSEVIAETIKSASAKIANDMDIKKEIAAEICKASGDGEQYDAAKQGTVLTDALVHASHARYEFMVTVGESFQRNKEEDTESYFTSFGKKVEELNNEFNEAIRSKLSALEELGINIAKLQKAMDDASNAMTLPQVGAAVGAAEINY